MRRVALALLGGAALLLAPCVALAQPPNAQIGTYQVPQPGGGTISDCAVQVGALPSTVFHPCHVMETVDQYSVPHPVGPLNPLPTANAQEHADLQALQASTTAMVSALGAPLQTGGGVSVTSSALPAGAATSAGQTAAQTSLGAIAVSAAAGATAALQTSNAAQAHADAQAIASAMPGLATGAATSAAQATGNASLAMIASQTSGLATAAGQAAAAGNQTTELTRLASISTNTASPAFPASGVTPVSTAISAAGASGSFTPLAGRTFHAQLTGAAVTTCILERKLDGTNWVPITATAGGTTTTLYNWSYSGSALSEDVVEPQTGVPYRVDCGAQLGSYTSGTLTVGLTQ